jgi:hypothetical protein
MKLYKDPIDPFKNVVKLEYLGMTAVHLNYIHKENKSRLILMECLLPFIPECFVFPVQKHRD